MTRRRGNGEGSAPVQRKDGRFQVNVRHLDSDGNSRRVTVYGKTAEAARAAARAAITRLEDGRPAVDSRDTVGAFTAHWLGTTLAVADRKATTKVIYGRIARGHVIGSRLGAMRLDQVRATHVEQWYGDLRARGLAPATIRLADTIMRMVMRTAVRDDLIARSPADPVARPTVPRKEAPYLKAGQVQQLLSAAASSSYGTLIEFLAWTGARRGEAMALRWVDVDEQLGVIQIRGTLARINGVLTVTEPKTAQSRRAMAITEPLSLLLRRIRREQVVARMAAGPAWIESGFLFTSATGGPRDPRQALTAVKRAAATAGLPESTTLHTIRHSVAAQLLTSGTPMPVTSKVLGHSSIAVTVDLYGHVAPEVQRAALESLGGAFGG